MTDLPAKSQWPEGLVVDYAMMKASEVAGLAPLYTLQDIAAMYDITVDTIKALEQNPEFVREARIEMMEIKKSAPHLQKKATMLLEMWLDQQAAVWISQHSDGTLAETLKVIEQITKISGLLEKQKAAIEASSPAASGPAVPTLNIVLTTPAQVSVEKVVN